MKSFSGLYGSKLEDNEKQEKKEYEEDMKICESCGKPVEFSEGTLTASGRWYCENCFRFKCENCKNCGEPNERINLIYAESGFFSDGEYYCETCYAEATDKKI